MADYDLKDIPTLDDVIEEASDTDDQAECDSSASFVATDAPAEATQATSDYPQAETQSVQIAYQELYDKSFEPLNTTADDLQAAIEAIELEPVIDRVVKKLLPDLELQLRFLIQRELEKQLPEELVVPADGTDRESSSMDEVG